MLLAGIPIFLNISSTSERERTSDDGERDNEKSDVDAFDERDNEKSGVDSFDGERDNEKSGVDSFDGERDNERAGDERDDERGDDNSGVDPLGDDARGCLITTRRLEAAGNRSGVLDRLKTEGVLDRRQQSQPSEFTGFSQQESLRVSK